MTLSIFISVLLFLKLATTPCFSFYLFSSAKLENRRVKQVLSWGRVGTGLRWQGKRARE
jgi:hypothetical protein